MAPRSSVVTLLFLLLTTVSSRALQPEGPTANECRDHIEAAIKNYLTGQQEEDTTDTLPTSEIYTRAQSNEDFVAENDIDDDISAPLDDHEETEDEETTIETPETDQTKHDDKREIKTDDADDDDDDDNGDEGTDKKDDDQEDNDQDDGKQEEDEREDGVAEAEDEQENGVEETDNEDKHVKITAEHDDDDDDDDKEDEEHTKKAEDHDEDDEDEEHAKKAEEHDEDDEDEEHAKKVEEHEDDDDDDDDDEEKAKKVAEDDDDDDDDDADKVQHDDDKKEKSDSDQSEDGEKEDDAKEAEQEEEEEDEGAELERIGKIQEEDVEVQIESPPTSERFQTDEESEDDDHEDEQGTTDTKTTEEDEEEDQETEDRVKRDAEEDGADQDEAPADDAEDDDESDKPEEQSPESSAAPPPDAEDDDQPATDESSHGTEGDDEEHDDVIPDEPTGESEETEGEEEEEEEVIIAGPGQLRTRENIETILGLGEDKIDDNKEREKIGGDILKEIKRMYEGAVRPLEQLYKFKDISTRQLGDAEIFSKPMVLFLGPWSTGKSAIINYLLGTEYSRYALKTGAEPTSNSFNVIMYGDSDQVLDGTQLAADWAFSTLQKFGQSFLDRLRGRKMSNPLLQKMTIVDSPGILENRKSTERQYPFNDAFQWFIDRADLIYIVFDPTKLDIGMELEAIFDQLKGRENQVRILLNKADTVKPQELMKVQGTLLWNLSPLLGTSEAPTVFVGSFWSRPYLPGSPETLLDAQEEAFLEDLHDALDHRVENKVALSRRHAVRVRNHAKMVDCYLNTYYNHKSIFSNKRKVADDIVENPQNYHIYEGLSILTNVSRYDLPDPDIYREFFRIHPLFDFKPLASTCSYFKGCPLDKLDIAIAYDLPELVGKYQRLMGNRPAMGGR